MNLMKKKVFGFTIALLLSLSMFNICENMNDTKYAKEINDNSQDKKIIYLTFDDGPSPTVTNEILDILKENNVKGTFFLVGNKIEDNKEVVKRIQNEKHSMGLHSYTHNYKKIYKSRESFVQEMFKCSDEIYKVTGERSHIIRFPGGSYKHLDEEFLSQLHGYGFKIYDWNVELRDGIDYRTPPETLYQQATKNTDRFSTIFLLMHCDSVNKNTCKALPRIIKYYKDKGYDFQVITEKTPEKHFRTIKINK